MLSAIQGLEPKRLWEYFAKLSAIPRCSKHEEKAIAYIRGVAKLLGLESEQDAIGNVLVRKKAHGGREDAPRIALQSHIDMVCEKNRDKVHDFFKDPLVLKRSGNFLTADGTTLGADNGMGVCTALSLMEDRSIRHGPLEFLFTLDEETGLSGAAGLQSGFLASRILINLDSEDEGVLYVGCSGGVDTIGTLPVGFDPMPAKHALFTLKVSALRGGHSGLEIHVGRGNAIKLLNRAMGALSPMGARVCTLEGGNKRNAIPREAAAVIAVPKAAVAALEEKVRELEKIYREEYSVLDGGVTLSLEPLEKKMTRVFKRSAQKKLINLLYALPHGVIAMNPSIPGLVETSTNLATVSTSKTGIMIATSQRSSVESEKNDLMQMVRSTFMLAGATVENSDGYPGWKPNLSSPILRVAQEVYRTLFGKEAEVKAVHAGLECGIIGEKYPGMDMVSLGPTLEMVHSPEERIVIDTVKKYWDFLTRILESV
jgi:dipeptidase D